MESAPVSLNSEVRVSTGIAGLDDLLQGGLPRNHLYLLQGYPGTGKTTIALQFLLEGVRIGEKALYVTFSESKAELISSAESHGWSLDKITISELEIENNKDSNDDRYTVFRPADVELGETTRKIYEQVIALQPARIVFDSLSEMRLLARDPLRYRREILGIKQFFRDRHCTILLIDDLSDPEQDGQLQSIAHGVIRLDVADNDYGTFRRRLHIVKLRGVKFHEGLHDFSIFRGGVEVFPRFSPIVPSVDAPNEIVKSGVAALDRLLGGGIDRGTSTLIMGPAGAGKSTLLTQYVFGALNRGERVSGYLFEEGMATFLARARGVKLDVEPFLKSGLLTLQQNDPAELSPGEFTFRVRKDVEQKNTRLVFIDSLNGYMNALPNERYLLIQMHELLRYLNSHNVLSFMVLAQQGMVGAIHGPVDVSYLADTAILIRYFESQGEIRQTIATIKRRRGAHERSLREFKITKDGIQIGEPLTDFQGVLTGAPIYRGEVLPLTNGNTKS